MSFFVWGWGGEGTQIVIYWQGNYEFNASKMLNHYAVQTEKNLYLSRVYIDAQDGHPTIEVLLTADPDGFLRVITETDVRLEGDG